MRVVDLFAGGGGVACAMRELGLAARHVELDPAACATLTAAGFHDVVQADVRDLARWVPAGPVDLLHGSPPCPRWSRATHATRRAATVDGWPWLLAAVRAVRPAVVTVENVPGAPALAWARELAAEGYTVAARVLNAMDHGEAQTRRRLCLVGARGRRPVLSAPTHGPGRAPYRTLGALLDPVGDRVVYPAGLGRAASEPWRLDRPAPTVTTTEVKGTRASMASGWTFHGGPDRLSDALFLALGWRRATVAECARAQGFPEGHPFQGTVTAQYRQAGNAVPRALALALLGAGVGAM